MFNLETAIADWRKGLLTAGVASPVQLEELENHLREEIERQTKVGLNEREAFDLVRIQGLTLNEAAEVVGVSVSTVQRRVSRSLLLLTKQLDDLRPTQQSG